MTHILGGPHREGHRGGGTIIWIECPDALIRREGEGRQRSEDKLGKG